MIQIYYGYGKGKTTAAIGQGIRARGAGMSVSLVQFLKDCNSGELGAVDFEIFKAPESLPFNPGREYQEWVDSAIGFIENCKSDMIILDEFLDAIPEFISEETALRLMNKNAEIIITGHKEIKSLFENADYITHMEKIKHPFDKGVKARKGIEF
jgi:cob(I)alamin adenosyltransferase